MREKSENPEASTKNLKDKRKGNITIQKFANNKNVLQVFKDDHYYLINRDLYDINKIMMMIDYHKLALLGQKFRSYSQGISRTEFVRLMANELRSNSMDIFDFTNLVFGVYKLFCEIDYNGDGSMQWEEFTQFIIDTVEGESGSNENEKDIKDKMAIEKAMTKYKRYEPSQNIIDYNIHKTDLNCAGYVSKTNKLFVNEYNTYILKVYNPLTGKIENTISIQKIIADLEQQNMEELIRNEKTSFSLLSQEKKNKLKQMSKSNSLNNILGANYVRRKMKEQKNFGQNLSVISFTVYNTILACLMSDKQIQFFNVGSNINGDLIYTVGTPSLQKRIWFLENHNIWFCSGNKEEDDEFFFLNELNIDVISRPGYPIYITSNDNPKYVNKVYRKKYSLLCKHKDEIYDIIETKRPFLILTACLDGLIRLINVEDNEFLKIWKFHNLGVKHLDYNPKLEANGYIISTGFEYFINIFCTDLSLDDAYKGKLEGHFAPVVNCRFICGSPICVSVDEEGNVRIWEILQKVCLQSIPMIKKNFTVNGFIIMGRINKILVYGNNMIFYDAKYKDSKDEDVVVKSDNYPIKVRFNKYYQQFFVCTLKDIRIYNKKGILEKTYRKVLENENFEAGCKIREFHFENNYRKFYLGFSNGAVMQYNAGNGSLIKTINQYEIEKEGINYYKFHHTKDVSSIYFFYQKRHFEKDNLLLLTTSLDSTIQVYNEYDPQSSSKLRAIKGGHTINEKKCEILSMDFSLSLCQFATGSTDGLIVVWDFEFSKIEDILYINPKYTKNKIDVICVKYLGNYPLLFSSYSDCSCIIWGVKPFKKMEGLPIIKFQNFYPTTLKLDLSVVTNAIFIENYMPKIKPNFINKMYFVKNPDSNKEKNKNKKKIDQDKKEELPPFQIDKGFLDYKVQDYFNPDEYKTEHLEGEEEVDEEKEKYLMLCDKKGYIKVLNLKGIFKKFENDIEKDYNKVGSNFNLLKKDDSNVESVLKHLMNKEPEKEKKIAQEKYDNIYVDNIVLTEWRGHNDSITDLIEIEDPLSYVTISADGYFRIWDNTFKNIGELNVIPPEGRLPTKEKKVPWKFIINEKKVLQKEINEVVKIFEEVNVPSIPKNSDLDKLMIKDYGNPVIEETEETKKKNDDENENELAKRKVKEKYESIYKKDDSDFTSSYEQIFLKNLTNKIDTIIANNPEEEGMGELSNNLIYKVINNRNKILERRNKVKENIKEEKLFKNSSKKLENEKNFETLSKSRKVSENSSNNISNAKNTIEHQNSIKEKLNIIKEEGYINNLNNEEEEQEQNMKYPSEVNKSTFTQKNFIKLKKRPSTQQEIQKVSVPSTMSDKFRTTRLKQSGRFYAESGSAIISKTPYRNMNYDDEYKNIYSKDKLWEKGNFKTFFGHFKNKSQPGKRKQIVPNNFNRDSLFSEKMLSELSKHFFDTKKDLLPSIKYALEKDINNLNINAKEKTENIVKTQFYLNSYKNCCKIRPNTSSTNNNSLIVNYFNSWNNVKLYTQEYINENEKKAELKKNRKTSTKFNNFRKNGF